MGIQETWAAVSQDLQGHGVKILIQFFAAHPDMQKQFPKFASVSTGDLAGNAEVGKQALVVMEALGSFVKVAADAGALAAAVKPMAASHKARNVTITQFKLIFPVIVKYIADNAGGSAADWTAALDTIGSAISAAQ